MPKKSGIPVGKVLGRGGVWGGDPANFSHSEIRIATEGCDFFTQRRGLLPKVFPLSKVFIPPLTPAYPRGGEDDLFWFLRRRHEGYICHSRAPIP